MSERLRDVFSALQGRLSAELSASRTALDHPVAKGDAAENNWLSMLDAHLPRRYCVGRGVVVDATGEKSDAIDLLIYDRQYTPLLYNHDGQRIVPAEAVYAVFEVKQHIDKRHIGYAGQKAASVRRLQRTSARVVHAGGDFDPRPPFRIPGGILALDSEWTPGFGDSFRGALANLPEDQRLDLGCVVHAGAFQVTYGEPGSPELQISPPETALAEFFLRLLARLQALGTVPAIDYRAYGAAFGLGG
jgi:hypothetical protein